jgi:hypothetical protein
MQPRPAPSGPFHNRRTMPQFPPKTHPAREYLIAAGRRWPGLWASCDAVRSEHPQPANCYLTDHWGAVALVECLHAQGDYEKLDELRTYDALQAARLIVPITTLACWRMTQGIYRVDPALFEALITTPINGDIPAAVLLRLPEWCIYIETPGLSVYRRDGQGHAALRGVFVRIDVDADAQHGLVLTLDMPDADDLESQTLPLRGNLEESIDQAIAAWQGSNPKIVAQIKHYVEPIINLLLYICSTADINGKRGQPGNPAPVRTRRDGWRLYAVEGPSTWDVGVRMGAALRAAYQAAEVGTGAEHSGPRGHIRRAHWHGFRSGPRKRPDGTDIPATDRPFDLKWLPPIPVNLVDLEDLPAVVRRVK